MIGGAVGAELAGDATVIHSQANEQIMLNSVELVDNDVAIVELDPADVVAIELDPAEVETRDITSGAFACCCSTVKNVEPQPIAWAPLAALAAFGGVLGGMIGGAVGAELAGDATVIH